MNITRIDRKVAGMISEKTMAVIKDAMQGSGLEVVRQSGRYSDQEYTIRIKFCTPVTPVDASKSYDQTAIDCGLATRGTKIYVQGREAIITDAKIKKYAFYFTDKPGTTYVIRFAGCKIKA